MQKQISYFILASFFALLVFGAANSHAQPSYGPNVDSFCSSNPYASQGCTLCHSPSSKTILTQAMQAYLASDFCYFCPTDSQCVQGPVCTDNDKDGYAQEGGTCGPVDCNDNNANVFPGAVEVCTDGIDNDCDGLIDTADPNASGCPVVCPDNDGDGFADAGCGGTDCDDTNNLVFPGATEVCTDGIDNDCDGLIDTKDPDAVGCPPVCTDNDGDLYNQEGGTCGAVDCNDADATVNPGAAEVCGDAIDNDCDGNVDEGCNPACVDADGDGFADAACGGTDCNDADPAINPAKAEVCGNGIDENCNGQWDDPCTACPDGGVLMIKKAEYKKGSLKVRGRSHIHTSVTLFDADTGEIIAGPVEVEGGKWKAKIKYEDPASVPSRVAASNEEGCTFERDVKMDGASEKDEDGYKDEEHGSKKDDDGDDEDDDEKDDD